MYSYTRIGRGKWEARKGMEEGRMDYILYRCREEERTFVYTPKKGIEDIKTVGVSRMGQNKYS